MATTGLHWAALVSILPSTISKQRRDKSPQQPSLHLHGRAGGCFGVDFAEMAAAQAPDNLHLAIVDDVGHSLHRQRPADINRHALDHVTG